MSLIAAFLIGLVVGMRTLTAPAVLLWVRDRGGIWAIVVSIGAIVEYALDIHPKAGARTGPPGLIPRILSGAFCGWQLTAMHGGSAIGGALLGAVGAVAGTFGSLPLRMAAIKAIGLVPSGLTEDVLAIVLAFLVIAYV